MSLFSFRSREITFEAAVADLRAPRWEARAGAAAALGTCEPEDQADAAVALRGVLGDPRADVRAAAVFSLAALGEREAALISPAVPAAIELLADSVPQVREAAAILLGHSRDRERAFSPLLAALREGPPEVRFQATVALAELDLAGALPHLVEALGDSDAEVRGNAVAAIGQLDPWPGDPDPRGRLLALLGDADPRPRFEAATVLARRGERAAVPVLCDFLADRDRALDAAQALSGLPDPRAAAPLRALLERWLTPPLLKLRAAHALALIDEDPMHAAHAELARATLRRGSESWREEARGLARELLDDLDRRAPG